MTTRLSQGLFFCVAASALAPWLHAQSFARPMVHSAPAGHSRPYIWVAGSLNPNGQVYGPGQTSCGIGTNGCYYYPSDIRTAYAIASIANSNGGAGITVGIVDAYSNTQTESDLQHFDSDFNLATCTVGNGCLTFYNQTGGSTLPGCSDTPANCQGWFGEQDLDIQWVHAIAPNAKIIVVCANNSSNANLFAAVTTAAGLADVVTNSYGGAEFSGEASNDSTFSGVSVPILFSSGDQQNGVDVEYPCTSPAVVCVGGTHLLETSTSFRSAEGAWGEGSGNGGGGGACSVYENQPAFQSGFATVCGSKRGAPDVSLVADPYTGVLVYFGTNAGSDGDAGLEVVGGTSVSSPVLAGIVALIDAARLNASKTVIGNNLNALLYQAVASPYYHYRMYDVTTLTNNFYAAAAGWDRASGLGVPLGPALSAYLVSLP
jgi:subtilase family serine protease